MATTIQGSGDSTFGGTIQSTGIDDNATSTAITIDSSENVGIGTSSPQSELDIVTGTVGGLNIEDGTAKHSLSGANITSYQGSSNTNVRSLGIDCQNFIVRSGVPTGTTTTERMRIDSSGNVLVGKTAPTISTTGVELRPNGQVFATQSGNYPLLLNRTTSDGDIIQLRKDGTTIGSIGVRAAVNVYLVNPSGSGTGLQFTTANSIIPCSSNGAGRDNVVDLGNGSFRFDDIYATNGNINTSDRNEKQDIEELTEAEQRVAIACKGLMRKFRWKDAVAEKGDDARIHFGIIAQDLQDAFTAEGLDAGKYAMFISTTWWETQTEVSAVEAVDATYDEEGNELTEAVEAKEAYTRTDTYETLEEAPEGATERTRLGVRYPELLAFIISAI